MVLYELFGNEMLKCINENTASAKCGVAFKYSCKWRFQFNPKKCSIIIYGKDHEKNVNVFMGKVPIAVKDGDKHLGLPLTNKPDYTMSFLEKRITEC